MSPFPAWFDFHRDPAIRRHPAAHGVYAYLIERPGSFAVPVAVKTYVLARAVGFRKIAVLEALNLLVRCGYLEEHERSANNVRTFTVRDTRAGRIPDHTTPTATRGRVAASSRRRNTP